MKRKILLTLIAICCIVVQAWAYDFSATNNPTSMGIFTEEKTSDDIFHFTAQTDNVTISMKKYGSAPSVSLEYCTSTDGTW